MAKTVTTRNKPTQADLQAQIDRVQMGLETAIVWIAQSNGSPLSHANAVALVKLIREGK